MPNFATNIRKTESRNNVKNLIKVHQVRSQIMYTDRYGGICAKRISIFGQFRAGRAAAKNFFDLP